MDVLPPDFAHLMYLVGMSLVAAVAFAIVFGEKKPTLDKDSE